MLILSSLKLLKTSEKGKKSWMNGVEIKLAILYKKRIKKKKN